MNIQNNNYNLNFGAKYLYPTQIKKMQPTPKNLGISFVEIAPQDFNDVKAIDKVNAMWKNAIFAENINSTVREIYREGIFSTCTPKIFAVTLQKKHFNKLKEEEVLGLVEVYKNGSGAYISNLQTNPEYMYNAKDASYRNIGGGIMDILKKMFPEKITAKSVYSATKFYEKNGFKLINPKTLEYQWTGKNKI